MNRPWILRGMLLAGTFLTWTTAHPAWQWLNRRQGFAIGRVEMAALQVQVDIYLPSVQV